MYSQLSFIFPRAQSSLECVTAQTSVTLYIWYCVIQTQFSLKQMVSQFLAKSLCRCYIIFSECNMSSIVHPNMKIHMLFFSMEHKLRFFFFFLKNSKYCLKVIPGIYKQMQIKYRCMSVLTEILWHVLTSERSVFCNSTS